MKVKGHIDMSLNQLKNVIIHVSEDFPSDSSVGQLVFRSDLNQLYVCVQTQPSVVWLPLSSKVQNFVYTQTTVANEWIINHSLGTTDVYVQVYANDNTSIIPNDIIIVDENTVKITFGENMSGKALISALTSTAYIKKVSKTYTFSESSTWTVNHGLGYYPQVTVIDNNNVVVVPHSITYPNENQIVISFGNDLIAGKAIVS